jgi:uncharacterized membrane protein YdbT with pleckstrin-like domain
MAAKTIELMPGEKMILSSNPHWWYFWKEVAASLGLIGLLLLVLAFDDGLVNDTIQFIAGIVFIVIIVATIYAYIGWKTTRFAITNQRVAYQSGIVQRRGVSIPLNRVNNVNFTQSFIARALNNGIVTIESAGETGDSVFENIPDPEHVRALIFQQVEADEQADSDRDAAALAKAMQEHIQPPATAPTAPAGPSAQERLKALDELRAQGLVNDAEFEIKRKQILEEL